MAEVRDFVVIEATLQTSTAPAATFGVNMLLIDDPLIPADTRFITVTPSDFATVLANDATLLAYATSWFGQKRQSAELRFGRWLSQFSSPTWYAGAAWEQDPAVWAAQANLTIDLNLDVATAQVTAIDFSSITTIAQVVTVLQAAIDGASLVAPFAAVTVSIDVLGRLCFEAVQPAVDTDVLEVDWAPIGYDTLVDIVNEQQLGGVPVETMTAAKTAISDIDDTWYNLHLRYDTSLVITPDAENQIVDLAASIETQDKLLDVLYFNATAKSSVITTDVGNRIKDLGFKRTMVIYTENTDQNPDAAAIGAVLPADEGTTSFAFEQLVGVTESGKLAPLTNAQKGVLADKGYNFIEVVGSNIFLASAEDGDGVQRSGITAGNEEKRIMLGRDWFTARIAEAIFTDQMNFPVQTFDNDTLTQIGAHILDQAQQAVTRKILIITADRPFTLNLPDADEITAAERASKKLIVNDAFTGFINSAINSYQIIGTWKI